MSRPAALLTRNGRPRRGCRGYTLVEILTATGLTLLMMTGVVAVLGTVSTSISTSRSGLEMMDRTRAAQRTLRRDLQNLTVTMLPPRRPESNEGYFEYVEGPIGPVIAPFAYAVNSEAGNSPDTSVGDMDDILMFTVRSPDAPFIGLVNGVPAQSNVAEIAWFVRGRTLYRRVMLVLPNVDVSGVPRAGFYGNYDLSVHYANSVFAANSLADLTKPECRFGHNPNSFPSHPHNIQPWGRQLFGTPPNVWYSGLKLPILCECSHPAWVAGDPLPTLPLSDAGQGFDAWLSPYTFPELQPSTGAHTNYYDPVTTPPPPSLRIGEEVILTNVNGFDVKAWDPGAPVLSSSGVALVPGDPGYIEALKQGVTSNNPAPASATVLSYGAYADLNYMCLLGPRWEPNPAGMPPLILPPLQLQQPNYSAPAGAPQSVFRGAGEDKSKVRGTVPYDQTAPSDWPPAAERLASVYDTWSFHYEHDGVNQNGGPTDDGADGFDNNGNGIVDDIGELETRPPYPYPLRGLQVKIRVFEPDGRQVREVTVVQDFLPK